MCDYYKGYKMNYKKAKVTLLGETGIGTAEIAARTCYDSFDKSENDKVKNWKEDKDTTGLSDIPSSDLLEKLAWVHFHHSVLEHVVVSFYIEGISRGVLQELARHRIQSLSVRSTRFTMGHVLYAYIACRYVEWKVVHFRKHVLNLDMFVHVDVEMTNVEIRNMFLMIDTIAEDMGDEFLTTVLTKKQIEVLEKYTEDGLDIDTQKDLYRELCGLPHKRNIGDRFKAIVTDNWKTDLVSTWNIRSLKNFLELRDSGAAWYQIRDLAKTIKEVLPEKYSKLIIKDK
jgi:thymidylate synthase (FAD)